MTQKKRCNSFQMLHDKEKAARNTNNELTELNSMCLRDSRNLQKVFFCLSFYHYFSDTSQYNFCDQLYIFRHVRFSENTFMQQIYNSIPVRYKDYFLCDGFSDFLSIVLFYVLQSHSLPRYFSWFVTEFVGAGITNYSCLSVAK